MNVKEIAQKVGELNKTIEALNQKHAMEEAKKNVLLDNFKESIKDYMEKYHVDFSGNLEECAKKIKAERDKVITEVEKEFELKSKIVDAIEKGNYEEANSLLGITTDNEEVAELINEVSDKVQKEFKEVMDEPVVDDVISDDTEVSDEPVVEKKTKKATTKKKASKKVEEKKETFEDIIQEDTNDVDEDDFFFEDGGNDLFEEEKPVVKKEKKSVKKEEVPFEEDEASPVEDTTSDEKNVLDDMSFSLDDDEDMDFGFGDLLSGSKFSV